MKSKLNLKKLVLTALFCAMSYVLTLVCHFNVMFLTFDLKDIPMVIFSLMYGPLYGVIVAAITSLIELVTISDTGIYGLIMNFISSAAFSLISGFIYKHKRSFAGAIASVGVAALSTTVIMLIANIIITPFYMGVTTSEVVALIPTLLLPFNACKTLLNGAAVLMLYKPVTTALKKAKLAPNASSTKTNLKKNLLLCVASAVIIAASIACVIVLLNGSFSFV